MISITEPKFHIWASTWDCGTYHICDQGRLRLRQACTVSPEPLLFTHMKYGSRRRVRPNIRHLAPMDCCACVFEEWVYGGLKSVIISWAGSFSSYQFAPHIQVATVDHHRALDELYTNTTCINSHSMTLHDLYNSVKLAQFYWDSDCQCMAGTCNSRNNTAALSPQKKLVFSCWS